MGDEPIFNLGETLDRIDHDWEIFRAMAGVFADQGPKDLMAIQDALAAGDAAALESAAHRLKGAILQFCAPKALEFTRMLEDAARAGMLKGACESCAVLERELERLLVALQQARAQGQPV